MNWNIKRKEPYTEPGVKRVPCIRCGGKGHAQWNICADDGLFRVLCKSCDVDLNRLVLEWAKHPKAKQLIEKYKDN